MFYSEGDEISFFNWIKSINCVKKSEGKGDTIVLHIKSFNPSNVCLRDIIALFHRYNIEMSQLKQFLNDKNKEWFFNNKKAYWHTKVFKN